MRTTPLTDDEMDKAVAQIAFDLGVTQERARAWAKEAQTQLLNDEKAMVTRETVVVRADTEHIYDEDVPAELVPRDQGTSKWPGTDLARSVVDTVKSQYSKIKN